MRRDDFNTEVIVTAERGMYLKLKEEPENENKLGKPERIIFSKRGIIPEFIELPLDMDVPSENSNAELAEEVEPTTKKTKSTRKKSSKK